jgi:hypothetical protein
MMKVLIIIAALLAITSGLAVADTYKCRDQYGAIIFTDDPSQTSANCTQEKPGNLSALNVTPTPDGESTSVQNAAEASPAISSEGGKSVEDLRDETEALVTRFNDARRQLYKPGLVRYKIEARRELAAIRADMRTLQDEIEAAPLSSSERAELLEKLAVITE